MKEKERTRISFDPIPVTTNFWFLLVKAIHGARAHVRSPRRATGQKHSCTSNKQANAPPPRRKERQTNGSQRLFPHIPLVPHSPPYSTLLHCLLRSVAYPLPKPTAAAASAAQAKLLPPLPGRRRRPRMLRYRITPGVHTSDSLSLSLWITGSLNFGPFLCRDSHGMGCDVMCLVGFGLCWMENASILFHLVELWYAGLGIVWAVHFFFSRIRFVISILETQCVLHLI